MQNNKIEVIKMKMIKENLCIHGFFFFSLMYQLIFFFWESMVIAEGEKLQTKLRRSSS